MIQPETPIFVRTFDFLTWLLPATNSFPRAHRHSFTQRLLDAAFDLQERLEEANERRGSARLEGLARADGALAKVEMEASRLMWEGERGFELGAGHVDIRPGPSHRVLCL